MYIHTYVSMWLNKPSGRQGSGASGGITNEEGSGARWQVRFCGGTYLEVHG